MNLRIKTKDPLRSAWILCLIALGAGCGGDDDQGQVPGATFDTFVLDQFENNTADNVEPVPINNLEFTFDEEPGAFDGLLTD